MSTIKITQYVFPNFLVAAGFSLRVVVGLAQHLKPTKVGHYKLRTTDENS
jgi:hypothetical protein